MNARSFFDTNVLLYADDESAPAKQRCSRDLVAEHRRSGTGVISLQVLPEYFVNLTRKLHVDPRIARRKVEMLESSTLLPLRSAISSPPSISIDPMGFLFGMR